MIPTLGISEDGTTYVLRFSWVKLKSPINIVMTVPEAQVLRDLMTKTLEKDGN